MSNDGTLSLDNRKSWRERIAEARESGQFTSEDGILSRYWFSCACGEQDPRIPRHDGPAGCGDPLDEELQGLGVRFDVCVMNNDFDEAEAVLGKIEARSALILAGLPA